MHSETVRTARFMVERAGKWMHANGVLKTWGTLRSLSLSGGPHYACTPSMGDDPGSSVLDRHRRVHGCDYLLNADTTVHVTNCRSKPSVTARALAFRTATLMLKTLASSSTIGSSLSGLGIYGTSVR